MARAVPVQFKPCDGLRQARCAVVRCEPVSSDARPVGCPILANPCFWSRLSNPSIISRRAKREDGDDLAHLLKMGLRYNRLQESGSIPWNDLEQSEYRDA